MNLGELKKSLAKFDDNINSSEVAFNFMENGKEKFDSLAFVGYTLFEGKHVVILGAQAVAIERMKNGTLKYPDGKKPADMGITLND